MDTNTTTPLQILKDKYLLIEDDRTCECHTHLVVEAMEEYAKLYHENMASKPNTKAEDTKAPQDSIKEIIMEQYNKGNIVVATSEGIQAMPLKEFIKQPADGMLYDLNRSEMIVLTFIKDPKWINDYAVAKVIRELKQQLDEKTN